VNGEARVGAYKYIDDGSDGSIVRKIAQVLRHPQFNEKTQENDVMLLLLDAPVLDTQLVELNSDPNFPISGQEVQAIGLGALQEPMNQIDDRYPKYLQEVTVQVVSNTDCQRQYQLVVQDVVRSEMHLCAAASGKDTCQGEYVYMRDSSVSTTPTDETLSRICRR
jgi:secreted trypsin-like serine protease